MAKSDKWKPKEGDICYYVTVKGGTKAVVKYFTWDNTKEKRAIRDLYKLYQTRGEAQMVAYKEQPKLKKWSEG